MKRLLFLISVLLIGSACAMEHVAVSSHEASSGVARRSCEATKTGVARNSGSSSGAAMPSRKASSGTAIQLHYANGYTYNLDYDHAITFAWDNWTKQSLTAEQVTRLNAQYLWEILRSHQDNHHTRACIIKHVDHFMSPTVFEFLRAALDSYAEETLGYAGSIQPTPRPRLAPQRPLPALDTNEREQLINACNFLMAPDFLIALQDYFSSPRNEVENKSWRARLKRWWQRNREYIISGMVATAPIAAAVTYQPTGSDTKDTTESLL